MLGMRRKDKGREPRKEVIELKITIDLADMDVEYFRTFAMSVERILNKSIDGAGILSRVIVGMEEDWNNHETELDEIKLPTVRLIEALRQAMFAEARAKE